MDIAAILISLAGLLLSAQAPARKPAEAGPCARCHINDTLEWGVSRHPSAGIACTACHGTSQGHVIEERNNVKPERLPRGAAIATLCRECHSAGCPKTRRQDACQTCHHVHALVDTNRKPEEIATQRIARTADRRPEYEKAFVCRRSLCREVAMERRTGAVSNKRAGRCPMILAPLPARRFAGVA